MKKLTMLIAAAAAAAAAFFWLGSAHAENGVRVAIYGDSTVWGSQLDGDEYVQTKRNAPATLQWLFQQKYGTRVIVENHGIPGSTCGNLLWGEANVPRPWVDEMASSTADIVVIDEAINDAFVSGLQHGDFIWCYEQIVGIARIYGKAVVIQTPNPVDSNHNETLWYLVHDQQWVASQLHVPMIDQWTTIVTEVQNWRELLTDGVHPNDELYGFSAALAYEALDPLVAGLLQARQP